MSSRTTNATSYAKGGIQWGVAALGWVAAVLASLLIGTVARQAYALSIGPPVEGGALTAVVISVISGFLSYLIGGCVAARMTHHSGVIHGALTVVPKFIAPSTRELTCTPVRPRVRYCMKVFLHSFVG